MSEARERIAEVIREYDEQGIHRTGTEVDRSSGHWLAKRVAEAGLEPRLVEFPFARRDPHGSVELAGRRFEGTPLYDCLPGEVDGRLGDVGGPGEIGVGRVSPLGGELMGARDSGAHGGLVALCEGSWFGMPEGPTLQNADRFAEPFGVPVVQLAGESAVALRDAAKSGERARLKVEFETRTVDASNVEARLAGTDPGLAPLVVMTPRSGWWECASERGGGIAAWLELIRRLTPSGSRRDVLFVATTGHELGHVGLSHFLERERALVRGAHAWIHFGANFAAAVRPAPRLQSSHPELEALALRELEAAGELPANRTPPGTPPVGEARNIFDGGGRYLSLLGSNGLFHHPDDRWPFAVDLDRTERLIDAFTRIARSLL